VIISKFVPILGQTLSIVMNTYKTYGLSLIVFFSFLALANNNEACAHTIKFEKTIQDSIPKQRSGTAQDKKTKRERDKTDASDAGAVKSVPRARRQAKPKIVRPKIDAAKSLRPKIRAKITTPIRIKV
jgi:hypothetical protein